MSSTAFSHLFPSAAVAAVSLLPGRVSLQLFCTSGEVAPRWRRSPRMAVVRAATADAAAPAYTSDSLILYFKAEGTMEERAIPKITESLELTKETTVQATGVASNLVEVIQGAGFKLQTLSLSFDDFDDVAAAGGNVQPSE
ncbi:uncharacterized protein [Miscanthus floridulus]|uniref:uncharacterized protein isoform X2 n=1 Tax=Miscanthus floridulus TaxID=154761 RepID=UPI00345A60AB